jgi:hypothetical protein
LYFGRLSLHNQKPRGNLSHPDQNCVVNQTVLFDTAFDGEWQDFFTVQEIDAIV